MFQVVAGLKLCIRFDSTGSANCHQRCKVRFIIQFKFSVVAVRKCVCGWHFQQAVREAATICPAPVSWPLAFWPWKWCPSHVWWATSVPILVFLGLSVFDLCPMYATDRPQMSDVRCTPSLNTPYARGGGIINLFISDMWSQKRLGNVLLLSRNVSLPVQTSSKMTDESDFVVIKC